MVSAIIIQARMSSTRLPGKVMMDLGGASLLSRVIERCFAIPGADIVCCAIADGEENDIVEHEAKQCGAVTFRGSLQDVLARYYLAAQKLDANVIMRITSDCPLIDPEICGEVLKLVTSKKAEYASNSMPAYWPHGLDCEAFKLNVLERTYHEAIDKFDREHVTTYMRQKMDIKKENYPPPNELDMSNNRWTVDTMLDFDFVKKIYSRLP